MSSKRVRQLLSTEQLIHNNKKQLTKQTMESQTPSDMFSWAKFCSILDIKLNEVAKKDDLAPLVAEILELKEENKKLRNDITKLTTRLEQIDRKTRSANIIVNGLKSKNINEVKTDFSLLCSNTLGVDVNVVTARMLSTECSFLITLDTNLQAVSALSARSKLKDKAIFIQKDYTTEEQNVRYNLRKINRNISKHKNNLKIRMGEFCIYINNKKFSWSLDSAVAYSKDDAEYLRILLSDCNYPVDIIVRDGNLLTDNPPNLPPK